MKTAFVTGAASGIGRASALRLAAGGCSIGLMDRAGDGLSATADQVTASGGRALMFVGDVSRADDVAAAIDGTVDTFGGLDAAVACAGIEVYGQVADMDLGDWDRALRVNLTGTMLVGRHAIPQLLQSKGAFVAIASDAGVRAAIDWTPYNVSKHGVVGLVKSMAVDYGPQGVRSNVVCPAFTETPMAERVLDAAKENRESWTEMVPLKRFATAEEIANVVFHLVSAEASYTNGHVYMVDGGALAGF